MPTEAQLWTFGLSMLAAGVGSTVATLLVLKVDVATLRTEFRDWVGFVGEQLEQLRVSIKDHSADDTHQFERLHDRMDKVKGS